MDTITITQDQFNLLVKAANATAALNGGDIDQAIEVLWQFRTKLKIISNKA